MTIKTLAAGANGYVLKAVVSKFLLAALQTVANKRYTLTDVESGSYLAELNADTTNHQLLACAKRPGS